MISKDAKTIPQTVDSSHKMYHSDNHPRSLQECSLIDISDTVFHGSMNQIRTLLEVS
ncbi:hypothetical protein HO839_02325 [Streptococcus suis]|nr:hypothetical protein [Streptococcus suis]